MDYQKLRKLSTMNRKDFSDYFHIPYRTVEDWDNNKRSCHQYLVDLMEYKLKHERIIENK